MTFWSNPSSDPQTRNIVYLCPLGMLPVSLSYSSTLCCILVSGYFPKGFNKVCEYEGSLLLVVDGHIDNFIQHFLSEDS